MDSLLTPPEAAERMRLAVGTLAKLRLYGGGPPFLRFGRRIRYRADDVEQWITAKPVFRSTADAGTAPLATSNL